MPCCAKFNEHPLEKHVEIPDGKVHKAKKVCGHCGKHLKWCLSNARLGEISDRNRKIDMVIAKLKHGKPR